MTLLDHTPLSHAQWTDPVTGAKGWLVVRSLVSDACTGGIRMRLGCTRPEVEDLAHGMALKTGVFGLPVGGAKGGIDFDPKDPGARGVLRRFVEHFEPWFQSRWVTAEDLGNPQWLIDEVFAELGLGQSFHAAIRRAPDPQATLQRVHRGLHAQAPGGRQLGDVVGGYGVAQACLGVADAWNATVGDTTVAVQGVGTMGGAAAWFLHQAGMKVVALADVQGTLYDPDGLDIPALLDARNRFGEIDRSQVPATVRRMESGEAVLSFDVDLLVPAAGSYAITLDNVVDVHARTIVEAANAAILPRAELMLAARRIPVIPGFVANAGAAVWAWWLLMGHLDDDPEVTLRVLRNEMLNKVRQLMVNGSMPQATAYQLADKQQTQEGQTLSIP